MIAIVQARMNSTRLPGKVLRSINGKPMLLRVVENLRKSLLIKQIIIATSKSSRDIKIENFCRKNKLEFFKGDLKDVSNRFKNLLEQNKYYHKSFLRISSDSPLIDYKLVDRCIRIFKKKKPNILTNVFPRTFPKGQSIEIINSRFFLKNQTKFISPQDKEHVTHFFYRKKFKKILNIRNQINYSSLNMCVDTYNDLKKMRLFFKKINTKRKLNQMNWVNLVRHFS